MQGASLTSRNFRCWFLASRQFSRGGDPASQRLYILPDPTVPSSGHPTVRPTDPTAKRPNRVCDPYGQGGQPLSSTEVQNLLPTIHKDWKVETKQNPDHKGDDQDHGTRQHVLPMALTREFAHVNFMAGSRFLHSLAAVAEMNAHFPALRMERRIVKRNWVTVSTVRCHTTVLGGLSRHDFHLAMVRAYVRASVIDHRVGYEIPM
jgi:pterin-4a-carbinolamine dehydratase